MKKELISVIIPVYNVEKFLPYSLESVTNQTYKNLEIILIDDGSTDQSKKICEDYAKIDKRIKLITQSNQGAATARNTGLDVAKGTYIGFVDSDDVISKRFYECLHKLIIETESDISECASVQISDEDLFNKHFFFDEIDNLDFITTDSLGALNRINSEEKYITGKSIVVWNKLYKRHLFNNIRFPIGKKYEDDLTTYKIFNKINKLVSTEKVLYNYVQRKNSLMHKAFSMERLEAIEVFDNYERFFNEYNNQYLYDKCLVRYLRILTTILEELCKSDYKNKPKVKKMLEQKFKEVYDKLEKNLKGLNSKELDYIENNKKIYYKNFYNMIKN